MSSLASDNYLPSELLLTIFDYLGHDDLYQLTHVSCRFSHLSLIAYFAKRKVAISPDGRIDLPSPIKTRDMLSFISKARFITSIHRLSCGLVHPHKSLLNDISNLTMILNNVECVEELMIDFLTSGETWTPALIRQVNAGNALVSGFSDLLTASTRVSRSMVVRNGASLKSVFQKGEKGNSPGKGLSWSFGRLFSSSDKLRKRSPDSRVVSGNDGPHSISSATGAPTKGALHAFEIHSIVLLSSPFLNWSIQILNSNNITDLTFGTIEFRDVNWSSFLSQINTPALKSIGFRGYTPFNDLVTFMGRHQNITILSVNNINFDDWCRVSNSTDSPSSLLDKLLNAFSNVQRLSCCPQGLVSLLSGVLHPSNPTVNIFPRLRVISILWSLGIGQQFRMAIVGDILAPIAHKLKDFQRAVFVIMYRADAGSNWRACPPPVLEQSPGGILYRPVAHTNASTTPEASNNSPAAVSVPPTSTLSTATTVFPTFTEIKLEVTSRADREGVPALMKALADTFTNVKHFRVDTRARAGRPAQENRLMKLYLCHHILKQFKQLKAVHIDGVRSKVAEREG